MEPNSEERLKRFRKDVVNLPPTKMVRKHLVFGSAFALPNEEAHYALIETVAERYRIHPTSVFMVGSGKLGFSIVPKKRYRPFGDSSDLDVTIVSEELFDRIWLEFYRAKINDIDWRKKDRFLKYLYKGWLRPDYFPEVKTATSDDWWEFFASVSKNQPAKVSGAIYRTWDFFEMYQGDCIKQCALAEKEQLA